MVEEASTTHPGDRPLAWRLLARLDRMLGISDLGGSKHDAVLMYHSVGGIPSTDYQYDIPRSVFREQVRIVSEAFEPVPLSALVGESSKTARVAVTFDDGFRNFPGAMSVLSHHGVPATVFVCPGLIGDVDPEFVRERHGLSPDARDILMTPEQLRTVADSDLFTIGNHTATHVDVSDISDEERLVDEVIGARKRLEARFGVTVNQFSYPYGGIDDRAADLVAESHEIGVTSRQSLITPGADLHLLPRIDTTKSADTLRFELTDLGDRLRRAVG